MHNFFPPNICSSDVLSPNPKEKWNFKMLCGTGRGELTNQTMLVTWSCVCAHIKPGLYLQGVVLFNALVIPLPLLIDFQHNTNILLELRCKCADFIQLLKEVCRTLKRVHGRVESCFFSENLLGWFRLLNNTEHLFPVLQKRLLTDRFKKNNKIPCEFSVRFC